MYRISNEKIVYEKDAFVFNDSYMRSFTIRSTTGLRIINIFIIICNYYVIKEPKPHLKMSSSGVIFSVYYCNFF